MEKKRIRYLDKHSPSLEGKHYLITGSSSGLGFECAKDLLYKGAEVTFMVRSKSKAEQCIEAIEEDLGHKVKASIALYDQTDSNSIKSCIASLPEAHYDAIVLNAGVYFPKKGSFCSNGIPLTLQVNAIGTQRCLEEFTKRYPNAKYIIINSIVNSSPKKGDYFAYFHQRKEKRSQDYAISKRVCMNIFSLYLQKGFRIYMTHPGIARTNIINSFAPIIKRLGNGFLYLFTHPAWKASLGMFLLCANDYTPGTYFVPRGLFEIAGYPKLRIIPKKAAKPASSWQKYWEKEGKNL